MKNEKVDKFLTEYEQLCIKHRMFINFYPEKIRIEPNPNDKGNETNKEWAWLSCLKRSIQNLKNKS